MCVVSMRAHTNSTTEISAKISRNYRRANFSGSNLKSPEVMRKADTSSREHMSPISKMNSSSAMSQLSTNGPKKFVIVQHNGVWNDTPFFLFQRAFKIQINTSHKRGINTEKRVYYFFVRFRGRKVPKNNIRWPHLASSAVSISWSSHSLADTQ